MSVNDDFGPDVDHDERAVLDAVAARLVTERPVPRPAFRGELRRRIAGRPALQRRLRLQGLAYLTAGASLLLVATAGVLEAGPLAPGDQPVAEPIAAITR